MLMPGIHPTRHLHTFKDGLRVWHVLMFSDDIPRCVSDTYLKQLEAAMGKAL